ncbi:hypothetical protein SAMN05192539_104914 [Paraburkholderia diazotrophica]|uniref:Uncharacterized protein n=1 Tax=Paraburkholderia diazotrophica TaxID=667676 RepID=A0A1H7EGQ9_9BURK|nr:hypothetical protein SAMN05192539_104914 [Paraburkholderia diazotrophica]
MRTGADVARNTSVADFSSLTIHMSLYTAYEEGHDSLTAAGLHGCAGTHHALDPGFSPSLDRC